MGGIIDPAQAAWAAYAAKHYFTRDTIASAHEAFIAAWHEGHAAGMIDCEMDRQT